MRILLLAIFVAACASAHPTQGAADRYYAITDVNAAGEECDAAAPRVDLAALIHDPRLFIGRCVSVSGIVDGWLVYESEDAFYRGADWNAGEGARYNHIGTYPQEATGVLHERVVHADVVGLVSTCEQFDADPNVIMVLGYCHHFVGPFLRVASIHQRSSPLPRLTGDVERVRIGDLGFAPSTWPDRATVERLASEWLHAIETRDLGAYARLAGRDALDLAQSWSEDAYVFADRNSPFLQFRRVNAPPQLAIFTRKSAGEPAATLVRAVEDSEGFACFCRLSDCTDRWPIFIRDASNEKDRPYVCADIYNGGEPGGAPEWVVRVSRSSQILTEPR
jgi:hypothetical protein